MYTCGYVVPVTTPPSCSFPFRCRLCVAGLERRDTRRAMLAASRIQRSFRSFRSLRRALLDEAALERLSEVRASLHMRFELVRFVLPIASHRARR